MKGGRGSILDPDVQTLFEFGAKFGPAIAAGQWWRLVTAGFLHGGLLHILMNSWVLFDLGAQVEELYGGARMLVIYFVANVVGFYLSALWRPETPSVGASAALFGHGRRDARARLPVSRRDGRHGAQRLWTVSRLPAAVQSAAGRRYGGAYRRAGRRIRVGVCGGPAGVSSESPLEQVWRIAAGLAIAATLYSFLKWYLWFSTAGQ